MYLVPIIKVTEHVGSFTVEDVTPNWSPSDTTGYGVQTMPKQNVSSAVLYITVPGATSEIMIDATGSMPNSPYQVMYHDLNMTKLESGKYKIRYVVSGVNVNNEPVESETYTYEVFIKDVECCVDKMAATIKCVSLDNIFKNEKSRTFAKLSVLLDLVKHANACGDINSASDMVDLIKLNCNCNC
jgi:hypothetical protein